jgi:hypothetical protein
LHSVKQVETPNLPQEFEPWVCDVDVLWSILHKLRALLREPVERAATAPTTTATAATAAADAHFSTLRLPV